MLHSLTRNAFLTRILLALFGLASAFGSVNAAMQASLGGMDLQIDFGANLDFGRGHHGDQRHNGDFGRDYDRDCGRDRDCTGRYGREPRTCSQYLHSGPCAMRDGRCEVCRDNRSCFMASLGKVDQGWCEVVRERKSCFMALDGIDREECEFLVERKSCFMAFKNRADQERCERRGVYNNSYDFWRD